MASDNDEINNFFQLSYLLYEEGTKAMVKFFLNHAADGGLQPNQFQKYVNDNFKNEDTCKKKLGKLFKDQYNKLFPEEGVEADINKIDISLLFKLIKHSFEGKGINTSDWIGETTPGDRILANIILLNKFRNDVAHAYCYRMPKVKFNTEWSKLSEILQVVGVDKNEIDLCGNKQLDDTDRQKIESLYLDISDDDFYQLMTDVSEWYDQRGLLNRLQVLLLEHFPDDEALKRVTSTSELLGLLTNKGLLSRTNLTVLYDVIKVTGQFGFDPSIKDKLPAFKDIKERKIVKFSEHTQTVFKLGKSLSDSEIKTLDGRYNFSVLKKYADSWNLILDFQRRGLLTENKIESVKKVLKRGK